MFKAYQTFQIWHTRLSKYCIPGFPNMVYQAFQIWHTRLSKYEHFLTGAYPEFYNFPPFFTIQPVLATREKQLALWRELILNYHNHYIQSWAIAADGSVNNVFA